jgi:hypothetical protein
VLGAAPVEGDEGVAGGPLRGALHPGPEQRPVELGRAQAADPVDQRDLAAERPHRSLAVAAHDRLAHEGRAPLGPGPLGCGLDQAPADAPPPVLGADDDPHLGQVLVVLTVLDLEGDPAQQPPVGVTGHPQEQLLVRRALTQLGGLLRHDDRRIVGAGLALLDGGQLRQLGEGGLVQRRRVQLLDRDHGHPLRLRPQGSAVTCFIVEP